MKNFRPFALLFLTLVAAALLGGCATMPATGRVRAARPATYAVIAVDSTGVLSQADFRRIEVGVIQYLLDEGYVQSGEKYVTDVLHADIVFRVRIAWQGKDGGFRVTEVVPSFSGAPPPASYASGGSATYAPAYGDSGWNYDPWWYDDYYGDSWFPYGAFAGILPFAPIYGWNRPHHGMPDHGEHRGPDRDHFHPRDRDGHGRAPDGYARGWNPRWHDASPPGGGPLRPDHDSGHWRPATSGWSRPGPRPAPGDRSRWHYQTPNPDHVTVMPRPDQVRPFRPVGAGRPDHWAARNPAVMDRRPERFEIPAAARAPAPVFSAPARSFSPPPPPPPPPPASAPAARDRDNDSNSHTAQR